MIFFLLTGSLYIQAQHNYEAVEQQHTAQAPCATFVNFSQSCDANGDVTVTFRVRNNTNVNVSNVWVYLDNNTTVASLGGTLPPGGISATITYQVPSGTSNLCLNIRLLNTQGQPCCYTRRCFAIDDCPCGSIDGFDVECLPRNPGSYELCFTVHNPSYSTNTVDVIMLSSNFNDLCIDSDPAPAPISISPIAPGSSGTVCVTLSGCNSSINSGVNITITPHLLQFSDPGYCCDLDPFTITTPNCCNSFQSTSSSSPADCDMSNGSATISVSGGTAPYSLTGVGPGVSFLGSSVTRNNLAAGTYNYTVTDANGCETRGTVVVSQLPCLCDNINDDTSGGQGVFNQSYTSDGDGFLCFTFDSYTQPDRIQIYVDGVLVDDSGLFSTDLTTAQVGTTYPNCTGATGGGGTPYSASVPVSTGQQITIVITGSSCSGSGTLWELQVDCQATPCGTVGPNHPTHASARKQHYQNGGTDTSYKAYRHSSKRIISNQSLQVSPNPVRETLTIRNSNPDVQYEIINVLDASGKIIKTDNMSGNAEISVDVSSLPKGIYFIDAMDNTGNKVIERFVKVN